MTQNLHAVRQSLMPLRAQADLTNQWLRERLDTLLPELMARADLDMWIVAAREYNEDPVILTLLPAPSMAARRRTILVFARRPDGSVERLTIDRYGFDEFYLRQWEPERESQMACLTRVVHERDPQRIGINVSRESAFGDGLSTHEFAYIRAALGDDYSRRLVSAEAVCVGWLERRIEPEMNVYPGIIALGHSLIHEAYSRQTITPGVTTTDDMVWWFRQMMHDLGLRAWFQPTVEIQAHGQRYDADEPRLVIQPGDLLHCDVGFYYLGLATDHQQHAYVLRPGETAAPAGLQAALVDGNRLQDILMTEMQVGRTGNQVLQSALSTATAAGINAQIYSHPLGYHGHAAGPIIGLWDQQQGVPGKGDYPLYDDTVYSIELNIKKAVPEWDDQEVRIALEEDAELTGGQMHWLAGRQTELHVIG